MEYEYFDNFGAAPLGAMTQAIKKQVWPNLSLYDADPNGKYFEIIDDDRLGGRCCRMKYPAGEVGMNSKFYQLRIPAPQSVCYLEFDWLAEDGFEFNTDPANNVGGGKIGPCINWGEVGGKTEDRGTRCMVWWNAHGSNNAKPVFSPSCQDQRSGNQWIQPVVYTAPIQCERVYHWEIEMKGGDNGYAKWWLDGQQIAAAGPRYMQAWNDDDVLFDFAFFHGGSGASYASTKDCFARHGNVHFRSGTRDSGGNGGNGGETGPNPPDPGPTPEPEPEPTSAFSIAVGETKQFEASFYDDKVYPPKLIVPVGPVKWTATPNPLRWGYGEDPWSTIEITGKEVGTCEVYATDAATGISTEPITVEVTAAPREPTIRSGKLVLVEKKTATPAKGRE